MSKDIYSDIDALIKANKLLKSELSDENFDAMNTKVLEIEVAYKALTLSMLRGRDEFNRVKRIFSGTMDQAIEQLEWILSEAEADRHGVREAFEAHIMQFISGHKDKIRSGEITPEEFTNLIKKEKYFFINNFKEKVQGSKK